MSGPLQLVALICMLAVPFSLAEGIAWTPCGAQYDSPEFMLKDVCNKTKDCTEGLHDFLKKIIKPGKEDSFDSACEEDPTLKRVVCWTRRKVFQGENELSMKTNWELQWWGDGKDTNECRYATPKVTPF
uniref:Secreted protein n=1 Tax=Cacopsylla melanoneura TaxID=428564 RepID=A0A8D8YII3_9HEMI